MNNAEPLSEQERRLFLELLERAGIEDPSGDLRRFERAGLASDTLTEAIQRRAKRVPVSHILGYRDFWNHRFKVTADVLDPRPDTETLVELALAEPFQTVLDLGTGSGCIVVSLLVERPEAQGVGSDLSPSALQIAGRNAEMAGVADRLALTRSDWFDRINGLFDLIVSNPPYIAADEMPGLAPEVRDHEPRLALTDEGDGLSAYRMIAQHAGKHLTANGRLLVEIGASQGAQVKEVFMSAGFEDISLHSDLNGLDRVVSARKTKS